MAVVLVVSVLITAIPRVRVIVVVILVAAAKARRHGGLRPAHEFVRTLCIEGGTG